MPEVSWSHAEITNTESETEELWHVQVDTDDVKVLTLDQLDDLFRLEIVDENVRVWQPGMAEWKTLAEVAGLEAEPSEITSIVPQKAELPSGVQTVAAEPWASRVVPPPPPPPAPRVLAPARSSFVSASLIEEDDLVQPVKSPETLRPVADDVNPFAPKPSRAGAWLTVLAAAAGVMLTLYRNDLLQSVAQNAGQGRVYSGVQSALGGPGYGTVASIDALERATIKTMPTQAESPNTEAKPAEESDTLKDLEVLAVDSMAMIRDPRKEKAAKAAPTVRQNSSAGFQSQKTKKSLNAGKASKYDPMNGTL